MHDSPRDDFDLAACGLARFDASGRSIRVNRTLCAWLGITESDLLQRRFQDLLTVGCKLFHQTQWLPLLQMQGSVAEVQLELVAHDGRVLPVLVNAVQRPSDSDGVVTDVAVFVAADRRKYERELLLARRAAEEQLVKTREAHEARADAESRVRLALDSAGLLVWSVDFTTGLRRYERGVAALLGIAIENEVCPHIFADCINPHDRANESASFDAALDPDRRAPYAVEYRLNGKDGVERVVRSTGRAFFDAQGHPERFSGVLEDVTERRRSEAMLRLRENEFRMVAENSPDVIARFDRGGRCLYLSPAASWFLARPVDDFVGLQVSGLPLLSKLSASVDEALSGVESTCAFPFDGSTGDHRELEARVVPERDAHGQVISALAITRDVTLLRQQEREAQQRAILAEQLMGIVSHDLRNPLHAMLLGTHLLSSVDLGPKQATVRRIAAAAQRANRLVSDILDFTRARLGGGLPADRQVIDLHLLIADCLEELRLAWPGHAIVHEQVGQGSASVDPDRLAQIVSNLVSNALVYGAPDKPVTVVSIVADRAMELRVHNAGAPIPAQLKTHMFEPLQRGDQPSGSGRSVGLGLYIVREIAKAHGGTVAVFSTAEDGTTFVVTLPQPEVETLIAPQDQSAPATL